MIRTGKRRKYHTELVAAAAHYREVAARLASADPPNLTEATTMERTAYNLRCRAAELEHHVATCPATFHLVGRD